MSLTNYVESVPIRMIDSADNTPADLMDTFGRRFSYLRLSLTDACNFRCTYCLPEGYCPSEKEQTLSVQDIEFLVQTLAQCGTKKVRLTGGEPTLRKDLPEIVSACSSINGIEEIALTSNGYRLNKQLPELIEAGITSLNLSADSLDPAVFHELTGHDKLDAVIDAMKMAIDSPLKSVKLNAVLMRQYNSGSIGRYLELVKEHPVSMRFIELMRTGDNKTFFNQQHFPATKIYDRLINEGWHKASKSALSGPAVVMRHEDYKGSIGLIMPYSKNFCADCNRMRIASNGKLHLCLFGDADADLLPYIKDRDQAALISYLKHAVKSKWQGHQLEQNNSGSMRNLATLGG